ncbi:MAG TPA: hypothetical protein VM537_29000 [Anaerolineae bacterium]|nr:hypothetical protein [Anaerolineae bacterium]
MYCITCHRLYVSIPFKRFAEYIWQPLPARAPESHQIVQFRR